MRASRREKGEGRRGKGEGGRGRAEGKSPFTLHPSPFSSLLLLLALATPAHAGSLTIDLGKSQGVTLVGAVHRWDEDGNARRPVDTKAKIDEPYVDAKATSTGTGRWVFEKLPPGKYDLVIMAKDRVRVEGFQFAPVQEFDPFFPGDATTDDETRETIVGDIAKSPHYENKVVPLYLGGDKKAVRVLLMLLRDKPTSYEADSPGAATIRHEIWQFSWNYGGWVKEKRTRVLDRILMHRDELRKWTWLWDPKLGGIEVTSQPTVIKYEVPAGAVAKKLKGLFPY